MMAGNAHTYAAPGRGAASMAVPSDAASSVMPASASGAARAGVPSLPVLPAGTELVVLGEGMRLFGAPARMAVFRSAHDASDMLDYVATRYPEFNQLHVEPQRITLAAVVDTCIQSISVAQAEAGGSVGSVASLCSAPRRHVINTAPGSAGEGQGEGATEFRLPASELLLDVSFTEDESDVLQQVWASSLRARDLDRAFRQRLAAQGWEVGERPEPAKGRYGVTDGATLAHHWRAGETLTYAVTSPAGGGPGTSGLWLRRTRPAGPGAGGHGQRALAQPQADSTGATP